MNSYVKRFILALALAALAFEPWAAPFATAQDLSATQDAPAARQTVAEKPLVRVRFLVTSEKTVAVPELRREDFRLLVDGKEHPISFFKKEESPVSYGLVVDNSGSLKDQFNYVLAAAKHIVNNNGPGDETFLVRFVASDKIDIFEDFTDDKALLAKGLDAMYIDRGPTALIDALYLSAEYLTKKARAAGDGSRRHALVLISDGSDRASYYRPDDLFKLLRNTNIQVFTIGLIGGLDDKDGFITKSTRKAAADFLKRLASETGGRVIFAEKVGELKEAIGEVIEDLHVQYVVGYEPTPDAAGKSPRKIEVKIVDVPGRVKLIAVIRPAARENKKPEK